MWNTSVELFQNYMGTGLIVVWFLVCLIYLFLQEKEKGRRILFLYVPVIILLLFFNPVFIWLVSRFVGDEIVYRILWLLPVTIVIAYTVIDIYGRLKGKMAALFLGIVTVSILFSGSCIYQNPVFNKAENWHHMPQEVVDICDMVKVDGREVMAVFPREMIPFVRQYSAYVCMPYGRDSFYHYDEFAVLMDSDEINVEDLARLAKQHGCHYIVIAEEKALVGNMEEYDYRKFGQVGKYIIYEDTTIYKGL